MSAEQVFIFTGPTLLPEHARPQLEATYLPPVSLGDIYRVCELYKPRAIGIIDGYFNQVPAVWHKEILDALSRGIEVFGSASMGALRASELAPLGMHGCGLIYQAYEKGVLPPFIDETFEDDDEVAVIHGPAELGYLAASDAMVNIRCTLARAMQQGVIEQATGLELAKMGKALFYADRTYSTLLETARDSELSASQLDTLRDWLPHNSVDQKQLDALEMLRCISDHLQRAEPTLAPAPPFQHTSQWQAAIDEIDRAHYTPHPAITELRLNGGDYFQALDNALKFSPQSDAQASDAEHPDLTQFHSSPDRLNKTLMEHWSRRQGWAHPGALSPAHSDLALLDHLGRTASLEPLEARAEDKQNVLSKLGDIPDSDSLTDLDQLQLSDWYFSSCLNSEIPPDLERYAADLGLEDMETFYDMLLHEYIYVNTDRDDGPTG